MSCDNKLKKECFNELETFVNELPDKNGALISVLHKAQEIFRLFTSRSTNFCS